MMPNALANTGAYADLWSHLKSIDHALERAMTEDDMSKLSDLDRERLRALMSLLRDSLAQHTDLRQVSRDSLRPRDSHTSIYSSDIRSLKERLRETREFTAWHAAAKMGFEKKVEKLIDSLEIYLQGASEELFGKGAPPEEFMILRAALALLLRDAESGLHA